MVIIIFSLINIQVQISVSVNNKLTSVHVEKYQQILKNLFLCVFPQDVSKDNDFPSPWSPFAEGGITTR